MAKTLTMDTVANVFADYNNVVILDGIGDKNVDGVAATTYTVFVPDTCIPHLKELRQYFNNNWNAKLFKHDDGKGALMTVEERLAAIPKIAASFEPSEAKAQTPLDRAVQNILCRMNPQAVAGLSGAALVKATKPDVERFKVSANLEKYRSQLEAELIAIQNATDKRSLRGVEGAEDVGVGFTFDTNEETTTD